MKTKVRLIIFSHLSDIQSGMCENPNERINFVKALLLNYPDTNVEITTEEADIIWKKYIIRKTA